MIITAALSRRYPGMRDRNLSVPAVSCCLLFGAKKRESTSYPYLKSYKFRIIDILCLCKKVYSYSCRIRRLERVVHVVCDDASLSDCNISQHYMEKNAISMDIKTKQHYTYRRFCIALPFRRIFLRRMP